MEQQELSVRECFVRELPKTDGKILLRVPTVQEIMDFNQYAKAEEDMSRFTCRPDVHHTPEEQRERLQKHLQEPDRLFVGIFLRKNSPSRMIGKLNFFDYNPRNKSMEFGYRLLKDYRRKGYMSCALKELLRIAFRKIGLHKVYAQTGGFNIPSVLLLKKLGFQQDGVLRDHHEMGGIFYDDLIFSILENEFSAESRMAPINR